MVQGKRTCKKCKSTNIKADSVYFFGNEIPRVVYKCVDCGEVWGISAKDIG